MRRRDLIIALLCEAALILVAGLAAWFVHQPLFFASLGPTAFELIETPGRPSARPYNVVVGHLIGVIWWIRSSGGGRMHGVRRPFPTSSISLLRVWAAAIAALPTVLFTLLVRAQQRAALSTTLLIATGSAPSPGRPNHQRRGMGSAGHLRCAVPRNTHPLRETTHSRSLARVGERPCAAAEQGRGGRSSVRLTSGSRQRGQVWLG